jgi:hypothetical protein
MKTSAWSSKSCPVKRDRKRKTSLVSMPAKRRGQRISDRTPVAVGEAESEAESEAASRGRRGASIVGKTKVRGGADNCWRWLRFAGAGTSGRRSAPGKGADAVLVQLLGHGADERLLGEHTDESHA